MNPASYCAIVGCSDKDITGMGVVAMIFLGGAVTIATSYWAYNAFSKYRNRK